MTLSARNRFTGPSTKYSSAMSSPTPPYVRFRDSVSESVITRRTEERGVKKRDSMTAVVKATEVMTSKA